MKIVFNRLKKMTSGVLLAVSLVSTAIAAPVTKKTYVDVMFLYSAGVEREAAGDVQTLIDHKVAVTNKILTDSGLDFAIRNVHSRKVSTSASDKSVEVLKRLTGNQAEFTGVTEERKEHGADMVVMLRPYANDGNCGVAWVGGWGRFGDMAGSKNSMYSHTSTNCGDYVMAHELGHNMGLSHSRRQAPEGGTYPYATGYGVEGQFVTVMAYSSAFRTRYKIYKFASPSLTCKGIPCGISQGDPVKGANAVATLRKTIPQIAKYLPSHQDKAHHKEANNHGDVLGMTKLFEHRDMKLVIPGDRPIDKFIGLPIGASRLVVITSGGSGDCNLYAHNKIWPDITHFTHKSAVEGNTNEKIVINNPGRVYGLSLFAERSSCEGVTMKAYYQ